MVRSSTQGIRPCIFGPLFIGNNKVEFYKEFRLLYLVLIEFLGTSKIPEILIIRIYLYLVYRATKVGFLFFKSLDNC
jgi:hypothetical protein